MLADLERRIEALEAAQRRTVCVGVVKTRLPERGAVTVDLKDADGVDSYTLPVLYPRTHLDQCYDGTPDVGEHVLCLFLPFAPEMGFVLGAIYSETERPPSSDPDVYVWKFKDGSTITFDRSAGTATVDATGDLICSAQGDIDLTGETSVNIDTPLLRIWATVMEGYQSRRPA